MVLATIFGVMAVAFGIGAYRNHTHPWSRWLVPAGALIVAVGFCLGSLGVLDAWIAVVIVGLVVQGGGSLVYNRWRNIYDPAPWQLDRKFGPSRKARLIQPNPRTRN